jgi:hypothetical protein
MRSEERFAGIGGGNSPFGPLAVALRTESKFCAGAWLGK